MKAESFLVCRVELVDGRPVLVVLQDFDSTKSLNKWLLKQKSLEKHYILTPLRP